MKHLGWILDLYHKTGEMVVWLKKKDGTCVRFTDSWRPRMHVGGDYRDLIELACKSFIKDSRFVDKFERAGDREKSRVLEITVESDSEAARLARRIQREGNYSKYQLYDVDIPSPQVYLYHKSLFPLALVDAEDRNGEVQWTLRDSREVIDYELPPLRKIKLQVKTCKKKRIQTFDDELGLIQIKSNDGEAVTIDSGSETEKILGLVEFFHEKDPDIVMTEGGDSFIFPYLARRAHENGILNRLILGRDPSPLRVYEVQGHSYFSYGKILYRETAARLLGRLHIDEHNAFISADCGLEGLFEVSRTCIIPIQRASRATIGTNMTSLQLYHAVKEDVLIPWNKNQPEEWKDGNELVIADRGGFIYEPKPGIHDQVGELDFTSLYPTLMLKNNISGETVKCKCCPDSTLRVPELDYHICRRPGIVPLSLDIILRRRAALKKLKRETTDELARSKFDERQSALKWILVCCLAPDSPVLTFQDGRISYQQIGRVVDQYLGETIGILDCPEELFVAGIDKNLKSKFCKVSKLIKVPSPEKLLQVRLEDGRQVKCTSNHSFYVLRSGSLVEVTAENLSKGDLLPVAKRVIHNRTVSSLNLLEQVSEKIELTEKDLWRAKSEGLRSLVDSTSNVLDGDVGFAAVKRVEEVEPTSPYVYCFQVSDDDNLPAFFTGSGGLLVHNCFGYLGFKNARFGKIDAHIATCAFSRAVLTQSVAIAEAEGFKLIHGIVDSMWLTKPNATISDYEELSALISKELDLPLGFEGLYKWIVFLNSKTDPHVPVLNRYYGVFQDGTIKIRGIDLRRHDTPGIVRDCQRDMLAALSGANNSREFLALIPEVLVVLKEYASRLREGQVPMEELVIVKNLSKNPDEYTHQVPQAIAARHFIREGGSVHAGQQVSYILTRDTLDTIENRALPPELVDENTRYDSERYVDLLISSTANLLLPFGYDVESLRRQI